MDEEFEFFNEESNPSRSFPYLENGGDEAQLTIINIIRCNDVKDVYFWVIDQQKQAALRTRNLLGYVSETFQSDFYQGKNKVNIKSNRHKN